MNLERYCAEQIRFLEAEEFVAIGPDVARALKKSYGDDPVPRLPDLISTKRDEKKVLWRLREVKFRLTEDLVTKAIDQLKSGAQYLQVAVPDSQIDRLEIVVPVQGRKLKPWEAVFLGDPLADGRYRLAQRPHVNGYEVTLLLV